jgi:hypothetical protein
VAPDQQKAYDESLAKYNEAMPLYDADRAKYDTYKAEYQNRMANTPMYGGAQFNTAPGGQPYAAPPSTIADLYQTYLGRAPDEGGAEFWANRFGPDLSAEEIGQFKQSASLENNKTKAVPHYWGSQLAQPTYSSNTASPAYAPISGVSGGSGVAGVAGVAGAAWPSILGGNNGGGNNSSSMGSLGPGLGFDSNSLTGGLAGAMLGFGGPVNEAVSVENMGTYANSNQSGGDGASSAGMGGASEGSAGSTAGDASSPDGPDGSNAWARGGYVKTNFQDGGLNDMANTYNVGQPQDAQGSAIQQLVAPPQVVAPPEMGGRAMPPGLAEMMGKYQGEGVYGPELKAARETSSRENEAFNKMLQSAIGQQQDNAPSKAEMYFRLAAAFGAPTKTGGFSESLANVGKTLGEQAKETREAEKAGRANRLALSLEAQKAKMSGAKEDLTTLRSLAGEEMKDKRAIASKMMEEYIKSGQPQSAAGKQAMDEGLVKGTPQFQARVAKIAENDINKQNAMINATLASMSSQQAAANLAQQRFGFQQEQSQKLTAPELKLKTETEDMVAQTGQAIANLKTAYALNPKTFDASLVDSAQRKILEASGSKAPKLQNTREMENLLEKAALSQLKATFPGAISNDERKALMDTQGLSAKSVEERAKIMRNAFTAMQSVEQRARKRLNEINAGLYRSTESSGSLD